MAKKNRNIHTPPDPSFHPPIFSSICQGTSSSALLKILCIGSKMEDGEWHKSLSSNPKGVLFTPKTSWHSSKIVGEKCVFFVIRGIDTRMISYHQCWIFWGKEVTQEFKVEYVALLRLFINSFSFWMPAMKSSFLQWSRTNHYQLQLSWGMLDLRIRKKLGVEAQI